MAEGAGMNAPLLPPRAVCPPHDEGVKLFLIAGEPSGDALGAGLMRALKRRAGRVGFAGVGGPAMELEGLRSLIPLSQISVMGIVPVLKRLPQLIARIGKIADAVLAANPDVLVIIDSPDFTHRVARRVRRARPNLPIVNYVGPSVWAWRAWRARAMCGYIDQVLALLPFEPAEYKRLEGPDCTYVGHPVLEQIGVLRSNPGEALRRDGSPPILVIMPGSRDSEIRRLMPIFAGVVERLSETHRLHFVLPTLPHLEDLVRAEAEKWPAKPRITTTAEGKHAAIRCARAALVASGSATLELALAGVPMVVAYRVSLIEELVARQMLSIDKIALPNLILGRHAVPECVQADCTATALTEALTPLLAGRRERKAQLMAFEELASLMNIGAEVMPSDRAAGIVESIAMRACAGRKQTA
jgi:lipid-A-disaccharide synthase